jgi:hypothetical protein
MSIHMANNKLKILVIPRKVKANKVSKLMSVPEIKALIAFKIYGHHNTPVKKDKW